MPTGFGGRPAMCSPIHDIPSHESSPKSTNRGHEIVTMAGATLSAQLLAMPHCLMAKSASKEINRQSECYDWTGGGSFQLLV
jgi:hypothetical protein